MDFDFPDEDLYTVDEYEDVVGWQLDTPSPLATLPVGLLVDVYLLAMDPGGSRRLNPYTSRSKTAWRSLVFFMSICKYWRAVILSTHILWRDVQFGEGVHHFITRKMLQRSVITPLHLTVCYKDTGRFGFVDGQDIEILGPHLFRVEKMDIRVIHLDHEKLLAGSRDTPQLRELRIEIYQEWGPLQPVPLISATHSIPLLDTLHANGVAFHHISPFFRPTLKRLHLEKSPFTFRPSVASFIESLQMMPFLEELSIVNFFNDATMHTNGSICPDATLKHLKNLQIEDELGGCALLLEHIVFPDSMLSESKQLTYKGVTYTSESTDVIVRYFAAMFTKFTGAGVLVSDAFPNINTLMLEVEGYAREASVHTFVRDEGQEPSQVCMSGYATSWQVTMGILQDIVCRAVPKSLGENIHTLTITVPLHFPQDEHFGWSRLFDTGESARFPNLSTLLLAGTPETWWGLVDAHCQLDAHSSFPFPKLQVLMLDYVVFRAGQVARTYPSPHDTDDFLFHLRDMLRLRNDAEVPIRTLGITNAARFGKEDAEMLRGFVKLVQWDGLLTEEDRYADRPPP